MSRLCVSNYQRPCLLRLRTHGHSSSVCLVKAPFVPSRLHLSRNLGFSLAASSEDSASISTTGSEADPVGEGSSKFASELSKFADEYEEALNAAKSEALEKGAESSQDAVPVKDGVLRAEAAVKEDGSEPANKFMGVLRDTTEELKEQAEKARAALAVTAQETAAALAATAQETAEKSKENLSYIAENAPDPIREIADTALKAHSADTPKKFAKIHDFCLGIPYGSTLVIGGLLWFIVSGSTAAIRFGVILGGILLGLSVSSLYAWKLGEPTTTHITGQAVISAILAFRQIRRLFEVKTLFPAAFFTLISAGMLGFYCYVVLAGGNPPPKKMRNATAA